jgi:transglutaminase-like putative cysteine protease
VNIFSEAPNFAAALFAAPWPCKREADVRERRRSTALTSLIAAVLCYCAFACVAMAAEVQPAAVTRTIALVDAGKFAEAEAGIAARLKSSSLAAAERTALEFERERMRRILLDFTLSQAQVKAKVREQIPDLADGEFAAWDQAGLFEKRVIDGRTLYFKRSPSNLFRLSPAAVARHKGGLGSFDGPMETPNDHHRAIRDAAGEGGRSVLPRRVRVRQSISVKADAVPAGETVRAWIPYPRSIEGQQEDIRLIESSPARHTLAPESTLQRTVYFESPAVAGKRTDFSITYELTIFGQHTAIDPNKVVPANLTPELLEQVGERPPHIVFTDAIRKFSRDTVGEEKNPYRIAQKLFAAVDRIPWAGALEYSTISNISDYALHAGHADCGQQTLLLMTLLRLNGIPARWQSGMIFSDGEYDNLHDWGMLYLAPYGWVPMDVTTGVMKSGDPTIANFYLGSLDAYRIAFNDDYAQPLFPDKQHFRSETVDSQRGEVEWRGGNLYFDQWGYEFTARVVPQQ